MLEFKLLGSVEIRTGGQVVDAGPMKQRAVLAVLLLDPGRPVATADLIERVWGVAPPRAASNVVYGHVSRIRRLIAERAGAGDPISLERSPDGYRLGVDPDRVDLHRAHRLAAGAPAGDDPALESALREAIGLWDREPLAGLAGNWFAQVRDQLRQQHLDLLLRWAEVALRLGDPAPVIETMRPVLAEHPLVEPAAAVLIRALRTAGRTAEALDVYAGVRTHLAEELGVDPGPELRRLHQETLQGTPRRPPVLSAAAPAHLPLDAFGFTGRERELAELDATLAREDQHPSAVRVIALSGTAGVGKTALALHWAHRIKDRFPAGQLYVNLHGYDAEAAILQPGDALRGFLEAFGVPPGRIPSGTRERADLYRSLLAGRRVLVMLDNARDAGHVRPLLPGSAGCLVVVTSRDALTGLIVLDGAHPVRLDVLPPAEAIRMLARRTDPARVAAEPEAAATIAERCARVPLALAIAAARASTRPGLPLRDLAAELAVGAGTLDALEGDDHGTSMRAVLSWSFHRLSPDAARLFRLYGAHPRSAISVEALASLAGVEPREVRVSLAELVRAHLLGEERGRYAGHDLLHEYAVELATPYPHEVLHRLLDHYACTAMVAANLLETGREHIEIPRPGTGVAVPALAGREQALAWFTTEHHTLTAVVALAARAGLHAQTCRLALAVSGYLDNQGHWRDWITVTRHASAAAQRLGDRDGQARAERLLGRAHAQIGSYDEARVHYEQALTLYATAGDAAGQASTHFSMSWLAELEEDPDGSLHHGELALALFEKAGHRIGQARALNSLGWDYACRGDYPKALGYCHRALGIQQELGDEDGQASTWDSIGYVYAQLGEPHEAAPCYEKALALYRRCGDRFNEADVLDHLGDARLSAGQHDAARAAWHRAVTILTELQHPAAARIEAKYASRAGR